MHYKSMQIPPPLTYEQAALINDFRVLMSRLAYLSRFYIVARVTGVGNPETIIEQLLRIPRELNELAATIPGFTVDFVPITSSYIDGLQQLIDAMLAGDEARADESIRELYNISNRNAAYLAGVSPYWNEETWRNIFYNFITAVVSEVIAIQSRDFNRALDVFDTMIQSAYQRGDYYAQGFIPFLTGDQAQIPIAYLNMIQDFRSIHTEWAYLTRFYIVSRISQFGNTEYVLQRLYALPATMQGKFKLILGNEIATRIFDYLLIYLAKLERLVGAILSGDQEEIDAQMADAYRYAAQVAAYLSGANPYWDEAEGRALFTSLADAVLRESTELQRQGSPEEMASFEDFLNISLQIADYFSEGLFRYALLGTGQVPEGQVGV